LLLDDVANDCKQQSNRRIIRDWIGVNSGGTNVVC
jgi:hypothetical protein